MAWLPFQKMGLKIPTWGRHDTSSSGVEIACPILQITKKIYKIFFLTTSLRPCSHSILLTMKAILCIGLKFKPVFSQKSEIHPLLEIGQFRKAKKLYLLCISTRTYKVLTKF